MSEANVAIGADNTAPGAHNIRTITVQIDNSNLVAGGQAEQQEVTTLADASGQLIQFAAGALPVSSPEIVLLLQAILVRLDMLNAYINVRYNPPDRFGIH